MSANPEQPSYEEAAAILTAEGAPFETVEERVLGERILVYKNRARSLRDLRGVLTGFRSGAFCHAKPSV